MSPALFHHCPRVPAHESVVTYHARAWVGDLALERDPLVVRPLFVSKGAQESPADVVHGVDTHRRAFEYTAAGRERERGGRVDITYYIPFHSNHDHRVHSQPEFWPPHPCIYLSHSVSLFHTHARTHTHTHTRTHARTHAQCVCKH